ATGGWGVGGVGSGRAGGGGGGMWVLVWGLIPPRNWGPWRGAAPPAAATTINAASSVQRKIAATRCQAPRFGGSGWRERVIGVGGAGGGEAGGAVLLGPRPPALLCGGLHPGRKQTGRPRGGPPPAGRA